MHVPITLAIRISLVFGARDCFLEIVVPQVHFCIACVRRMYCLLTMHCQCSHIDNN